jgi:hypothetical protein
MEKVRQDSTLSEHALMCLATTGAFEMLYPESGGIVQASEQSLCFAVSADIRECPSQVWPRKVEQIDFETPIEMGKAAHGKFGMSVRGGRVEWGLTVLPT